MKQIILRTASLLVFLLAGTFATAQAQPITRFKVDIPFNFIVNNQELPAGTYDIRFRENGNLDQLRLSHIETKKSVTIFSNTKETQIPPTSSKFLFRRYGNQYFLGEVWTRGETYGHELMPSSAEKRLRKQIRRDDLAVNPFPASKTERARPAGTQ